jgi:tetratricopeptide (TPR) repeat protein
MRKELFSGNHPDIADSLNNIGLVYISLGQKEEALAYFNQAIEIRMNPKRPSNTTIALDYTKGSIYISLSQTQLIT